MGTFAESVASGGRQVGRSRHEAVEIVDYDPVWMERFAEVRARLLASMGQRAIRIEHIGSTSVPGLAAKPYVDVQISVADADNDAAYIPLIESEGFEMRWIEAGHRYLRPPPDKPRLWQVHTCTAGSDWERDHMLFRDYLRSHPDTAIEYAALKRRVAEEFRQESIAYTDAKGPFIESVLARAEEWAQETGWSVS
ncbi:MAG: GrpB family protein [Candidatus Limnocylindrales bacterium]